VPVPPCWSLSAENMGVIANVLLTAGLVYFAGAEIRIAKAARKARERTAAVRISAEAYNAYPRIQALVRGFTADPSPASQSSGIPGHAQASWAAGLRSQELTQNMNTLLVIAGEASDQVFKAVELAYYDFRKASEEAVACELSWMAGADKDIGIVLDQARAARDLLDRCVQHLRSVISPVLLAQTLRLPTIEGATARDEAHATVKRPE
jgi:hypothetical protein